MASERRPTGARHRHLCRMAAVPSASHAAAICAILPSMKKHEKEVSNWCCTLPKAVVQAVKMAFWEHWKKRRAHFLVFSLVFVAVVIASMCAPLMAQQLVSVPVDNSIYSLLDKAAMRGIIDPLPAARPYSERKIRALISDILAAQDAADEKPLRGTEVQVIEEWLNLHSRKEGFDPQKCEYYFANDNNFHKSFDFTFTMDMFLSCGAYNKSGVSEWGASWTPDFGFKGDLSEYVSYNLDLFGNIARAKLDDMGPYEVRGAKGWKDDPDGTLRANRKITAYRNNAFFPFSYHKTWDGSVYKPSDMTADGLEGWPDGMALGFGITSEIDAAFIGDVFQFRFGRIRHEWAAMDKGSSLVLSDGARQFLAFEQIITPAKWFTLSTMTGILEFPNSDYIVADQGQSIYRTANDRTDDNAFYFQNAYSITMLELNFPYVHVDGGTTAVWPKRFEAGYLFPLMNTVFYQNNIGDFDNLSLFGDLKLSHPKLGYIWGSVYMDEINGLKGVFGNKINEARNMFAYQVGVKATLPMPFATVALRYTKVEPYCYTHQAINDTPWYDHYISEAYMNSGECIGYYLPPNSDEINLRFEVEPMPSFSLHAEYQFIRHGADYGSQAVRGSSLYSELQPDGRDDVKKYFLHDGAYQWYHIFKVGGSLSLRKYDLPITLYGDMGVMYSYFTVLSEDGYANSHSDEEGFEYKKRSYSKASGDKEDEYPSTFGVIVTVGMRVFF